jgi:hypothetical protein
LVMGGAVYINAMSFDVMRVRAALDTGARLWHMLVIKNLALLWTTRRTPKPAPSPPKRPRPQLRRRAKQPT